MDELKQAVEIASKLNRKERDKLRLVLGRMDEKEVEVEQWVPLEVGRRYMTKMATKEHFTVTRLDKWFNPWGKYDGGPDCECPIDESRLIK